jgi:protein SCO1
MDQVFRWFVLAAVAGLAAAMLLACDRSPAEDLILEYGVSIDQPRPLADFELVDHRHRKLTPDQFRGQWNIAFIGFTHCPDVCPATLTRLAHLESRLGEQGRAVQTVFVSVDPERDSVEELARYAGFFGSELVAATGSPDQLDRFTGTLDFAYVKVPQGNGRYTVDHSGALALIDPQARLVGYFTPPFDLEGIEADLVRLARRTSSPSM